MKTQVCLHGQKNKQTNKSIHLYSKREVLSRVWSIVPNLWPVKWHSAFKPYADQAAKQGQSAAEILRAPAKFKVQRKSEELSLPGRGKKKNSPNYIRLEAEVYKMHEIITVYLQQDHRRQNKKRRWSENNILTLLVLEDNKGSLNRKLNYLLHHIVNSVLLSCKNEN